MSGNTLVDEARSVLMPVCERFGLDPRGATLLVRSNVVFGLQAPIVVRIATSADAASRMTVTRWLAGLGFPAVQSADEITETHVAWQGRTVTFWRYVPDLIHT